MTVPHRQFEIKHHQTAFVVPLGELVLKVHLDLNFSHLPGVLIPERHQKTGLLADPAFPEIGWFHSDRQVSPPWPFFVRVQLGSLLTIPRPGDRLELPDFSFLEQ